MVLADERILEFLESEGPHSPKRIADSGFVNYSRQYVNTRLTILEDVGLVEKNRIGRGVYGITEDGESYLAGKLDAADLKPEE